MSITVGWYDDEQTIIYQHLEGTWTVSEWRNVIRKDIGDLMRSVDHTVHIIGDYLDSETMPIFGLAQARSTIATIPDNLGKMVVITDNNLINTMARVFNALKLGNGQLEAYTVRSLEEALELLQVETK